MAQLERELRSCRREVYLFVERAYSHIREGARRPIESSSANECSLTKSAAAASAAARGAHATGTYRVSRRPNGPLAQEPCDLVYRAVTPSHAKGLGGHGRGKTWN
eukprot:scaffold107126_cov30-Phaeocystis_antarctica.AAC.1